MILACLTLAHQLVRTDALNDVRLKGAIVGAIVTDINGKVLYEKNADIRLMPASNQKLLSCAFALSERGADFQSRTDFWSEDQTDGSSILSIAAFGNATLTTNDITIAAQKFAGKKVNRVRLYQKYRENRPDTWQIGDAPNRYAPMITALSMERSGVELWSNAGALEFRPYTPEIQLEKLSPNGNFAFNFDPFTSRVNYSGAVPEATKRLDTLSVPDPDKQVVRYLVSKIQPGATDLPISEITQDNLPSRAPDYSIAGQPLSKTLGECLKPSDNCLAEHMIMYGSNESTHEKARNSLSKWLIDKVGFKKSDFNIADGSGLSRKDNVTARSISKLLLWSYKQPTRQLWMDSLARGGQGTLANRLKTTNFFGKTGTLDMVSCLSGYVKLSNGSIRIVSVLMNHYGCSAADARAIQDRFIENVSN